MYVCFLIKKKKKKNLWEIKIWYFKNALIVKKENKNGYSSFRFWEYMVLEKWYQNYLYDFGYSGYRYSSKCEPSIRKNFQSVSEAHWSGYCLLHIAYDIPQYTNISIQKVFGNMWFTC